MRRRYSSAGYLERCRRIKEALDTPAFTTDVIVGFPGETDGDFELLLDWLDEAQLDRVGCFRYEPVKGAVANDLAAPVPDDGPRASECVSAC